MIENYLVDARPASAYRALPEGLSYLCPNTWFLAAYGANGVYYKVAPIRRTAGMMPSRQRYNWGALPGLAGSAQHRFLSRDQVEELFRDIENIFRLAVRTLEHRCLNRVSGLFLFYLG
jgi:hypothetical protein